MSWRTNGKSGTRASTPQLSIHSTGKTINTSPDEHFSESVGESHHAKQVDAAADHDRRDDGADDGEQCDRADVLEKVPLQNTQHCYSYIP